MESTIKISVVIPAYNVAQWLPRCVDSVLNQSHKNLEILLIDDGSTDETPRIVDTYAAKDPRIVAIHQENAGLVAVREHGITMSSGQYVGFVDGDDMVEPDFFHRLLHNALKYDADISHCGMKYCFYDGRVKLHYGTGEILLFDRSAGLRELLSGTKIEPSLCNKLYRREILSDSCLDPEIVNNEDLLRNFTLFSRANRSVFEDFCGYQYWRRAESMSNNSFRAKIYRDILCTRSLILTNADENIQDVAARSYLNALISSYNATIGLKTEDALQLSADCRFELKRLKAHLSSLPRGLYLRAAAILYAPIVYHPLYKLHQVQIKRKIKADSAKAQKERSL